MKSCRVEAVALVLGFGLGVVAGEWHARQQWADRWTSKDRQAKKLEMFSRRLHMTPEQKAAVEKFLESKHEQLMALRSEMRPQFQRIRQDTSRQIRVLLTPEQAKEFDKIESEFEERRRQRHSK